jgi:hypothetical protein
VKDLANAALETTELALFSSSIEVRRSTPPSFLIKKNIVG